MAERLGCADPVDVMAKHCRGVVKRHPIVDALGRTREARILSEPDVLRLIVGAGEAAPTGPSPRSGIYTGPHCR